MEPVLSHYAAFLAYSGLKCQSIKSYISAIRCYQILSGHGNPGIGGMCRLEYVLKGIKGEQARSPHSDTRTRLPITPRILGALRYVWEKEKHSWDNIMLWAAICTCFFGFLRSGEICVPSQNTYDPGAHLSFALDDPHDPSYAQITIKASETDPFWKGVTMCLGLTTWSCARW